MNNRNDELVELIAGMVNEGYAELVGDVAGIGCYAKVELDEDEDTQEKVMEVTGDDIVYHGAIYREDSQGFKEVTLYETQEELINAWREVENDEELYQNEMEN